MTLYEEIQYFCQKALDLTALKDLPDDNSMTSRQEAEFRQKMAKTIMDRMERNLFNVLSGYGVNQVRAAPVAEQQSGRLVVNDTP